MSTSEVVVGRLGVAPGLRMKPALLGPWHAEGTGHRRLGLDREQRFDDAGAIRGCTRAGGAGGMRIDLAALLGDASRATEVVVEQMPALPKELAAAQSGLGPRVHVGARRPAERQGFAGCDEVGFGTPQAGVLAPVRHGVGEGHEQDGAVGVQRG